MNGNFKLKFQFKLVPVEDITDSCTTSLRYLCILMTEREIDPDFKIHNLGISHLLFHRGKQGSARQHQIHSKLRPHATILWLLLLPSATTKFWKKVEPAENLVCAVHRNRNMNNPGFGEWRCSRIPEGHAGDAIQYVVFSSSICAGMIMKSSKSWRDSRELTLGFTKVEFRSRNCDQVDGFSPILSPAQVNTLFAAKPMAEV